MCLFLCEIIRFFDLDFLIKSNISKSNYGLISIVYDWKLIYFSVQSKLSPELLLTVLTEETLAVQDKFIGHHFFHWVDRCEAGRAHFTGRQLEL